MKQGKNHKPENSSAPNALAQIDKKRRMKSPGRPKIPLERIIEAAMEIIDAHGIDALTMRAVADHLNSGTATLYRHFSGRPELIGHIVDRILSEASLDDTNADPTDWQSIITNNARSMYEVLTRYKGIAALLVESIPEGPNAMDQRERFIGLLLANGFSPEITSRAFTTISRFVLGFAIQVREQPDFVTAAGEPSSLYQRGMDLEKYPALHAVAEHLPVELNEEFEFGLKLILSGLTVLNERA